MYGKGLTYRRPILFGYARSVVDDLDDVFAVILDPHFNTRGTGVQAVLDELLDRLLELEHDLASVDPVNRLALDG